MTISQPSVTLNIIPASLQISNAPQKVLAIGQMTTGTATAGAVVQNIQNDGSEDALFGANSMLAGMIRAYKKINQVTQIDAIGLADNGSGVAAAGAIAFTGPATGAGSFTAQIGSPDYVVTIPIASGNTATQVGAALATAINALTDCPVTATNTTGSVALAFDNAGPHGNNASIIVSGGAAGIAYTVSPFASGATPPATTTLFDPIQDLRYQTVIWPNGWSLSTVANFLDGRWNVTNQILDGVAVTVNADTYANQLTAVSALNSKSLVVIGNNLPTHVANSYEGPAIAELPYVEAAQFAAIRALRLTQDANIANYVIANNGADDTFGGPAIASLPYFNTPFYDLPLIPPGKAWHLQDVENLLDAGVGVLSNNVTATQIIAGEIPTTYHTDVAGNPDPSFKFLNYVDTISNVREYMWNNLRKRFAQSRLTEGDLLPGRSMANAQSIEAYITQLYTDLSGEDFVLTQAGEAALKFFKDNLTVTLDMVNGAATVNMQAPIVVQLRTIIATLQLTFSVNS